MKKALSLYYTHANNALGSTTKTYAEALSRLGYETIVIDLSAPDGFDRLMPALAGGGIDFCYGVQGVGSNLETNNGVNLWTACRTPFLCIHFDNPCYNPFNHFNGSRYVANMYSFESFLDIKKRFLPSDQISVAVPFKLPTACLPAVRDVDVFNARPINFLYLKTGGSLREHEEYINSLPQLVRDGIRQQLERAFASPNLQLCDLADEILVASGFDRRKQEKQFWGVVQTMDDYLRRKRAIRFVDWLKFQEGAVIIGDGWDFIDKTGARATFKQGIPIDEIFPYHSQSKFLCNTNPYGRDIVHDRILIGLMSNSCVISDTNAWLDKNLGGVAALIRFDWTLPLDDQLQPALHAPGAGRRAQTGPAAAIEVFIKDASAQPLIDLAQKVRQFAG